MLHRGLQDLTHIRLGVLASNGIVLLVSESHEAANCSLQSLVSKAGRTKGTAGKLFFLTARRGSCRYAAVYICMAPDSDEWVLPIHRLG